VLACIALLSIPIFVEIRWFESLGEVGLNRMKMCCVCIWGLKLMPSGAWRRAVKPVVPDFWRIIAPSGSSSPLKVHYSPLKLRVLLAQWHGITYQKTYSLEVPLWEPKISRVCFSTGFNNCLHYQIALNLSSEFFWLVTNLTHNFFYVTFSWILYMFRATMCSSSGGQLYWPFKPRIKSHLLFAGIIRSSLFSPR